MKWKMLFRLGLTLVILVAIILFYINNVYEKEKQKSRLSELLKSDAIVHNGIEALNKDSLGQGSVIDISTHQEAVGDSSQNGHIHIEGTNVDDKQREQETVPSEPVSASEQSIGLKPSITR